MTDQMRSPYEPFSALDAGDDPPADDETRATVDEVRQTIGHDDCVRVLFDNGDTWICVNIVDQEFIEVLMSRYFADLDRSLDRNAHIRDNLQLTAYLMNAESDMDGCRFRMRYWLSFRPRVASGVMDVMRMLHGQLGEMYWEGVPFERPPGGVASPRVKVAEV